MVVRWGAVSNLSLATIDVVIYCETSHFTDATCSFLWLTLQFHWHFGWIRQQMWIWYAQWHPSRLYNRANFSLFWMAFECAAEKWKKHQHTYTCVHYINSNEQFANANYRNSFENFMIWNSLSIKGYVVFMHVCGRTVGTTLLSACVCV